MYPPLVPRGGLVAKRVQENLLRKFAPVDGIHYENVLVPEPTLLEGAAGGSHCRGAPNPRGPFLQKKGKREKQNCRNFTENLKCSGNDKLS